MFAWLNRNVDSRPAYPKGPEGLTIYAIGDIHGRADCLARTFDSIDRDKQSRGVSKASVEIYLGDYVDRGPDSKGVIDRLLARSQATDTVLLRGNHEIMMESFLRGLTPFSEWRPLGGLETVMSYGVDGRGILTLSGDGPRRALAEKLPLSHMRFFPTLRAHCVLGPYLFVHAGLRPGVPLAEQTVDDMTWIREDFLTYPGDFGHIVVHGHTPVQDIEYLPNRVNIDTGAYASNRLSVIRIDDEGLSPVSTNVK